MAEFSGRHVFLPQSGVPIVAVHAGVGAKEMDVSRLQERLRRQGAILERGGAIP